MIYIALIFFIVASASLVIIAKAFIFLGSQKPRIEYMSTGFLPPVIEDRRELEKFTFDLSIDERDQRLQSNGYQRSLLHDHAASVGIKMLEDGFFETIKDDSHRNPPWISTTRYVLRVFRPRK
jgi:hypothetical protein